MKLPLERSVHSEIFVIVRRFLQKLEAYKLNMIKRGKLARHPRTIWWNSEYSQNYYTYNSVMKNTYSPCHEDVCVQISIANTEWLLHYKCVS